MKKTSIEYLQDILSSIEMIVKYMDGVTWEMFVEDLEKQDAVVRRFEIIGEASSRLEKGFRVQYEMIPWKKIVGLRNILIHEYDQVELDHIWQVLEKGELESLRDGVGKIVAEIGEKNE